MTWIGSLRQAGVRLSACRTRIYSTRAIGEKVRGEWPDDVPSHVLKRFDDGFVIRTITHRHANAIQAWWSRVAPTSSIDIHAAIDIFRDKTDGMLVGELHGEVVSCVLMVPWGDNVVFGGAGIVKPEHRGKGLVYATRTVLQAMDQAVANNTIVYGDIALELTNYWWQILHKNELHRLAEYTGPVLARTLVTPPAHIVQYSHDDRLFRKIIDYDNKCFVSANNPHRAALLARWFTIGAGATYVAIDRRSGDVTGYACRRPCMHPASHEVGPLYADSPDIAADLLQCLMLGVPGQTFTAYASMQNLPAVDLLTRYGLTCRQQFVRNCFSTVDIVKQPPQVFVYTSADICGF